MEYIDLGLPSGKLWCIDNEEGYFTFDEAVEKFQDQLPTMEDWLELDSYTKKHYDKERELAILKGRNSNKLFLPTTGFYIEDRRLIVPECGCYWSSDLETGDIPTLCGSVRTAKNFVFNTINNRVFTNTFYWNYCDCRLAVRLIKTK